MKLALLFPGQGSQKVGMGQQLAQDFPPARAVFEEANSALRMNLSRLCFEGPENDLRAGAYHGGEPRGRPVMNAGR